MAKIASDILGQWRIIEIEGRDPKDAKSEAQAFIQFDADGLGDFAFGYVEGFIDYRLREREGKPGVEWTWNGTEETDDVSGRGWAVLHHDRLLRGMFFIHRGNETDFVAKKVGARKPEAFSKSEAKATPRQGQYLAFIDHYTKLNGHPSPPRTRTGAACVLPRGPPVDHRAVVGNEMHHL